jgi:hypothetical protein
MEDQQKSANQATARAWKNAWGNRSYRLKTIIGTVLFLSILASLPFFFSIIELRHGSLLNDRLLHILPAIDVSIPTFIIIWAMVILLLYRCTQDPSLFLRFLWAFIILSLSRMLTISLFPLEPPDGLIPLKDPISSIFYGGTEVFIKKDLFYSGHTSIQFLIFLSLKKKSDKIITLLATATIGTLVLIQHVHYTIDVAAAIILTYFIYRMGKWVATY